MILVGEHLIETGDVAGDEGIEGILAFVGQWDVIGNCPMNAQRGELSIINGKAGGAGVAALDKRLVATDGRCVDVIVIVPHDVARGWADGFRGEQVRHVAADPVGESVVIEREPEILRISGKIENGVTRNAGIDGCIEPAYPEVRAGDLLPAGASRI